MIAALHQTVGNVTIVRTSLNLERKGHLNEVCIKRKFIIMKQDFKCVYETIF